MDSVDKFVDGLLNYVVALLVFFPDYYGAVFEQQQYRVPINIRHSVLRSLRMRVRK